MKKETKKKEKNIVELSNTPPEPIDSLWALIILSSLFWQPNKPEKVINIYMGDE